MSTTSLEYNDIEIITKNESDLNNIFEPRNYEVHNQTNYRDYIEAQITYPGTQNVDIVMEDISNKITHNSIANVIKPLEREKLCESVATTNRNRIILASICTVCSFILLISIIIFAVSR